MSQPRFTQSFQHPAKYLMRDDHNFLESSLHLDYLLIMTKTTSRVELVV